MLVRWRSRSVSLATQPLGMRIARKQQIDLSDYRFGNKPKFLPMILSNQLSGNIKGRNQLRIGLGTMA